MGTWLTLLVLSLTSIAQTTAELETKLAANPESLKTRLQLADKYAVEEKPEKVIELLNPYTDQMPSNGFLLLANSYFKKKDFPNEVRVLGLLVHKEPENFRWHMLLGRAYLKQA